MIGSCFISDIDKENRRINQEIERMIRKSELESRRNVKLLILGTGDSGKSTFIKQMRIIHGSGYSSEEKKAFIKLVVHDVWSAINSLMDAMDNIDSVAYSSTISEVYAEKIRQVDYSKFAYLEVDQVCFVLCSPLFLSMIYNYFYIRI